MPKLFNFKEFTTVHRQKYMSKKRVREKERERERKREKDLRL